MPRGPKPAKSKEAKSTVARKSSKDDGARVRDLAEARAQQRATAEILRVIGSSPTDVQPVFDKIALNAVKVCDAAFCAVFREDGGLVHLVAHHNFTDGGLAEIQRLFPMSLQASQTAARLIVSGKAVHVADVLTDERIPSGQRRVAEVQGYRGFLGIPMLRDAKAIGAIAVARREVGLFSESQVELLHTFADQAVIAIENVRLFKELQTSNRELTTTLDKQTATSDILRVISQSQTDVQPVFDVIARSAHQLLSGYAAALVHLVGNKVHLGAYTTTRNEGDTTLTSRFPLSIDQLASQNPSLAQVLLDGEIDHVPDFEDPSVGEFARSLARARGHRSRVMVPLRRGGTVVGGLAVTRAESGRFSEDEIALLRTFADQAVIAIENVRLFTELQEKNSALTKAHAQVSEALEQQTATSEILQTIAQAQTDVQPVFDTIAKRA